MAATRHLHGNHAATEQHLHRICTALHGSCAARQSGIGRSVRRRDLASAPAPW
jgi:hypothetical protein